ncbi:MAG: L-threonylcarbamoyladenylate synthase [Saprospiraceae bacterium]|jgi:tRNA threonylcarbamoyl adenosine modification protein (Sua5/YciO/YrdC/YwlC family)
MLITIHADNPDERKVRQIVDILQKGGVIIYPTDTVYGLGCDIRNQEAVEKICQMRHLDPRDAMLAIICKDLSQVSEYAHPIPNPVFRLLRKNLPGPFTFILNAAGAAPKLFRNKKKTIGVRIPGHRIPIAIVEALGHPILTTSLKSDDEILEYFVEAEDIHDDFRRQVDAVIDGGTCGNVPSTIVDCTRETPVVLRQGAGNLEYV